MDKSKIVLITGATRGIGFATAQVLARAGHTVLMGARDPGRGEQAARAVAEEGGDATWVPLDVTDHDGVDTTATLVGDRYGRLDILVNNAGITLDRSRAPGELPVAALRGTYETNVFGVVAVTNAMLPLLRRSATPTIGNVTSGLGTVAFLTDPDPQLRRYATLLAYNSSKAALNAVTLIYAEHLRAEGFVVNALSPGFCATDLNGHTGWTTAEEGGAHIARQVLDPDRGVTGVFLSEQGGTHPW